MPIQYCTGPSNGVDWSLLSYRWKQPSGVLSHNMILYPALGNNSDCLTRSWTKYKTHPIPNVVDRSISDTFPINSGVVKAPFCLQFSSYCVSMISWNLHFYIFWWWHYRLLCFPSSSHSIHKITILETSHNCQNLSQSEQLFRCRLQSPALILNTYTNSRTLMQRPHTAIYNIIKVWPRFITYRSY